MKTFTYIGSEQCQNNKPLNIPKLPYKKKTKHQPKDLPDLSEKQEKTESTEMASHPYQAAAVDNIHTVKRDRKC